MKSKTDRPSRLGGRARRTPLKAIIAADCVELLKQRLLQQKLESIDDSNLRRWLTVAADESAAVAWTTPYPLLVLPELIEEGARAARIKVERQRSILERGRLQRTFAA